MTKELADLLAMQLRESGHDTKVIDYSGRGMYGRQTTGLVVDSVAHLAAAAFAVGFYAADDAQEDFIEELFNLRSDSLGRRIVYY